MKNIKKKIPLIIIATTILTTGCEKKLEILQKEPTTYKKIDKLKGFSTNINYIKPIK